MAEMVAGGLGGLQMLRMCLWSQWHWVPTSGATRTKGGHLAPTQGSAGPAGPE